ncbi:hypothetical protein GQ53DRAFT_872304 [Thozetella sp. PMI_491]|nr:hypothetical protein GQ53DRAFT_872304 [Thozetella sp. PMI_491]
MDKGFQFVNGPRADKTARRLIRSHVMRGKNTGKTIHRQSRLELAGQLPGWSNSQKRASELANLDEAGADWRYFCPATIARNIGDLFLTLAFPLEPTPYSLRVINQFFEYVAEKVYPVKLGFPACDAKSMWLQVFLSDEAACHCAIASMEACNNFFLHGGDASTEALYHLSQTLALLNERLQSNEALSDSTLAIIVMLLIQEQIRKGRMEAEIHYTGLQKLVELRGGLCTLEENPTLLLKICKMGVAYSLEYGRPLLFFRDRMAEVRNVLVSRGFNFHRTPGYHPTQLNELDPRLRGVLTDVMSFSNLINSISLDKPLDIISYHEMIVSICCRLVEFHPLQSLERLSNTDSAYHIGMTVFMMTIYLQFDNRRIANYELVSLHLRKALEHRTDGLDANFLLWLTFVSSVWIMNGPDRSWVIKRLRELAAQCSFNNWNEVRCSFTLFPWIDALHTEPSCTVWNSVHNQPILK